MEAPSEGPEQRIHTSGDATPPWEDVLIRLNDSSVVLSLVLVYVYTGSSRVKRGRLIELEGALRAVKVGE